MIRNLIHRRAALAALALPFAACEWAMEKIYVGGMEKLGKEKRDILARRVADGREDQQEAKEQFQTTLEAFQELTGFDGGELEKVYNKLNREYERSEARAERVSERIDGIERVAKAMFNEWGQEISEIGSADLRSKSRALLDDTKDRYSRLIAAMKQAEAKMQPVLGAFRDQVLFLKHNLNAQAIQSLSEVVLEIDDDVAALVADIEASIAEADEFVAALEG